ncbi:MAG: hypothetical protein KAW41_03515 [Candidatus Diapherotrites archaeon]|nr:hypothetical protein [Candidatus Diapherotrites archaeon]
MKLSHSLHRGILETTVGSVINKFKVKKRRNTLFFEELIARYAQACERRGKGDKLREICDEWGRLTSHILIPAPIKSSPPRLIFLMSGEVWKNLGLLTDVHTRISGTEIKLITENEFLSELIGPNAAMTGFFVGTTKVVFNSNAEIVKVVGKNKKIIYTIRLTKGKPIFNAKDKEKYNKLNKLSPIDGFTLNDAIKKGIFRVRDSRIYFRGKRICIIENTIFHLLSNNNLLLDEVPDISQGFFSEIIEKTASASEKLNLLKTLLQVMGWGRVTIQMETNKVILSIYKPPYGLQLENENWAFLSSVILGYIRLINKKFQFVSSTKKGEALALIFQIS